MKNRFGFTLIELLVTVSIISLLSSMVLFSINKASSKSREAVRKSDLKQLQNALETYYSEFNAYPSTGNNWWGASVNGGNRGVNGVNAYIPGLTPTYMSILPLDPAGDKSGWSGYNYRSDGQNYKLISHTVGPETFPQAGGAFYDPIRPTWALMVCSDEPACSTW